MFWMNEKSVTDIQRNKQNLPENLVVVICVEAKGSVAFSLHLVREQTTCAR